MKFHPCSVHRATVLSAVTLLLLVNPGCKKSESPTEQGASESKRAAAEPQAGVEPTSFAKVTSQLDPGGRVYLYLSTEQLLGNLSGRVSEFRDVVASLPDSGDAGAVRHGFAIVTAIAKNSGLESLDGVGMSSIQREKDIFHNKFILHRKGAGSGLLWSVLGKAPHPLTGLDLLPAATALAVYGDVDVAAAWTEVQKLVNDSGVGPAIQALAKAPTAFQAATGIDFNELLASLGGEAGIALILQPDRKMMIPLPTGNTLEIPEAGFLVMAKVKNDFLFKKLAEKFDATGMALKSEKDGVQMRTLQLPMPLPLPFRPTIALAGDYVVLGSTELLVEEFAGVKAGKKPGLKSNADFKRMTTGVQTTGNNFVYVSQRLGEALQQVQQTLIASAPREARLSAFQQLLGGGEPLVAYIVGSNTDGGWVMQGNANRAGTALVAGPVLIPTVGLLAAIAIPNFVKARSTAQKNACINNLRMMEGATQQWALENRKKDTDTVDVTAMKAFLRGDQLPTCPAGGSYSFGTVGDAPKCSIPQHTFPN